VDVDIAGGLLCRQGRLLLGKRSARRGAYPGVWDMPGGHVEVGDGANLGLGTSVHQGRRIGPGAMLGMGSVVTRDVPPYAKAYGNPCRVRGANAVGMTRGGLPQDAVDFLAAAYARGAVPDGQEPPPSLRAAWCWWRSRVRW